jgi:hypothetical protein
VREDSPAPAEISKGTPELLEDDDTDEFFLAQFADTLDVFSEPTEPFNADNAANGHLLFDAVGDITLSEASTSSTPIGETARPSSQLLHSQPPNLQPPFVSDASGDITLSEASTPSVPADQTARSSSQSPNSQPPLVSDVLRRRLDRTISIRGSWPFNRP